MGSVKGRPCTDQLGDYWLLIVSADYINIGRCQFEFLLRISSIIVTCKRELDLRNNSIFIYMIGLFYNLNVIVALKLIGTVLCDFTE